MEVKGNKLWINNAINSRTYDQFVKALEQNSQIETIVQGDMPGSWDDTMIKLSYFVRENDLNTKILLDSQIQSGAVDFFWPVWNVSFK